MKPRLSRPQWLCVAYVALHLFAHILARWFEVAPGIAIWYPPCGLALVLFVLLGPRFALVVFLANFATAWLAPTPRVLWTAFFFPGLITATYAATAWLVRRSIGPRLLPGGSRETRVFILAVAGAPLVVALIGTTVAEVAFGAGQVPNTLHFLRSVLDWWIGDASGLLTVVPVAMVFVGPWIGGQPPAIEVRPWQWSQLAFALTRGLFLVSTVIVVLAVPVLREHSAFYLCFLPLVWICVRHGLPGATLATLTVTVVGLFGMRLTGSTAEFAYVFLLFEIAVAGVGLGLGTLVTRRNEVERKLATSQAQLDRVIAGAQLGLWDWNISTRRVEANERLAGMLGYRLVEIKPFLERWRTLVHPVDYARVDAAFTAHLAGCSELYETEFRMQAKDGHWRWVHARGSVVLRDSEGRPQQVAGTHVDITDRKRAEAEVGRLLEIIEATPDFVLTTDVQGRVIFANAALLAFWNLLESDAAWRGRRLAELFPGEPGRRLCNEAMPAALATGTWRGEITLAGARERAFPASLVVFAHRDDESDAFTLSFIMRDISEQKHAETERVAHERKLQQLQKAESLGVLAGGIAHDFNNLLTAIVGNANLARFESPPDAAAQALLTNIEQAAARASVLCQQMLAYAGRTAVAFTEVNLNQLVDAAFQLIKPSLSKKIVVQVELAQPHALVLAASTQMQQVVMNLALNAAEAIGDGDGRLTLRTRCRPFETGELDELFPGQALPAGDYALLEVEDTGVGMTPGIQARIFEPFFTTKFTGQGLGLAAVIGVVRSHRGAIAVRSASGAGATFRVAFPAVRAQALTAVEASATDDNWCGSGTILIVDDDPLLREVTRRMLAKIGFSILLAGDGEEGLAMFREHAGRLRCVLLDLTMPRMDGFEAHTAMHQHNPAVPVIMMSGFSQKLAHLPPEAIHPAGVLAKPFGMQQLRDRLKAVLTDSIRRGGS